MKNANGTGKERKRRERERKAEGERAPVMNTQHSPNKIIIIMIIECVRRTRVIFQSLNYTLDYSSTKELNKIKCILCIIC